MIYYFRDHLGNGTAPLVDIEAAIKNGILSDQPLVSVDGVTWQSVESAKKPPALPPQPISHHVQEKKKTSLLTWIVLVLAIVGFLGHFLQKFSETPESIAQDRLSSRVMGTAIAAVKTRLKDGKGADFDMQSISWRQRKDGAYEVTGEVRATNSFGAMLNNRWCIIMRENDIGDFFTVLYARIGDTREGVYPVE
jgi:hypothetical protein